MLNIVICDDSQPAIADVKNALAAYASNTHNEFNIKSFNSAKALVYELEDNIIADIYFLDVMMPDIDGFSVAAKIREKSESAVIIFLTSLEARASEGYKVKALRYLSKFHIEQDFDEAMDCALKELEKETERSIILHRYNDRWRVPFSNIISVQRVMRQLVIQTERFGELTDNRGIKELFESLNDMRFVMIDRSCFVNLEYIIGIDGNDLLLKDGRRLAVSRRALPAVKEAIAAYWGNN